MSENLIYGADITAYGALGDGVTDCSGAFAEALKNGESLISVPYGNYILKKPIALSSNTQIHVHPNAVITFSPEKSGTYPMIYAENCGSIIINGGIFKFDSSCADEKATFFGFKDVYGIRICGCTINGGSAEAISLEGCQCVTISDVKLSSNGNGIEILGDSQDLTVKKVVSDTPSASFISFGNVGMGCSLMKMQIRDISVKNGRIVFDFLSGKAQDLRLEGIRAAFGENFLKVGEAFALDDIELEEINAHHLSESGDDAAYFHFCGSCDSLEIRGFKRESSMESFPLASTLIFKDADRAKILIDGIALDNVIAARGKSKSVAMTTARLTNPWGKFTYTLECKVRSGDTLSLPLGDFEYFRQDKA